MRTKSGHFLYTMGFTDDWEDVLLEKQAFYGNWITTIEGYLLCQRKKNRTEWKFVPIYLNLIDFDFDYARIAFSKVPEHLEYEFLDKYIFRRDISFLQPLE